MTRIIPLALVLAVPGIVWAGKVKTYTAATPAAHDNARLDHVVVSSEGAVRLARDWKPLAARVDATRIWDVVEEKSGALLLATGDEGKLLRVQRDGAVETVYTSPASQLLCLCRAPDGTIFVGAGPGGQVIRIGADGKAKVIFNRGRGYIWSLVYEETTGTLFAGSGPDGRIDAIKPDGQSKVILQTKQDHVLCLALSPDKSLLAGTDKLGLIYRIDATGKATVVFQAAQSEVRCLCVGAGGFFAGTSSPGRVKTGGATTSTGGGSAVAALTKQGPGDVLSAGSDKVKLAGSSSKSKSEEADKPTAAAAPSAPASGENSVYFIGFDGAVREIYRDKGLMLSLLSRGPKLLVGTGLKGQLIEVDVETRERHEVARVDQGAVQKLLMRRDGSIVAAGGDPARLDVLTDAFASSGELVSEPIDAKLVARWGSLSIQADRPPGTALAVNVRVGNTSEPDETWSRWTKEVMEDEPLDVPNGRYLQYRVVMTTNQPSATPTLRQLSVRYASLNQAPEVTSLDVAAGESAKDPQKPRIKWSATDANEDELVFDIFVRKDGWPDWVRIEEGWAKSDFELDATALPTGTYRVRVVASDRTDNAESAALTGERVSHPFSISHEAPKVTVKMTSVNNGRALIEASAGSELVRLASASWAIDGGKWNNLMPQDGLFDARRETFRFRTDMLPSGVHALVIRVKDQAGNVGAADVVFYVGK